MKTAELRSRHLEILKLALLDLAGSSTGRVENGKVVEVPVDDRQRASGLDWPARAMTMVGRRRLDHLQHLVEEIIRKRIKGDLIEAGVWRGGASMLMKAVVDAHGDRKRRVVLADSFRGVPRPERPRGDQGDDLHRFSDYLAVSRAQVETHFKRYGLLDERVEFVEGWFDKTMPLLAGRRWSLMRLDGDLYESVMPPLEHLYDGLAKGGFVIIDDWAIPQAQAAATDFRETRGITAPIEPIDGIAVFWRKT